MRAPLYFRLLACLSAALLLAVLGACAMPRMIDSDVQTFTTTVKAVAPASYRFERLPSQQSPQQDALEALAAAAMAKVGLTQAPAGQTAAALYAAQVSVQVTRMDSPYPTGNYWLGQNGWHRRSWLDLTLEPQWYRHAVRIVLREAASSQVVYETTATFDGPWSDSANLLPAILDAALQGYPQPPAGPRKVVIELPAPEARP